MLTAITLIQKLIIIWLSLSFIGFGFFLWAVKYDRLPKYYEPKEIIPLDECEKKVSE